MNLQSWNLVFLLGFVAYIWIRGVYSGRTKTNKHVYEKHFSGDRVMLVLVFVGSLLVPLVYLFSPLLNFANYRMPLWAHELGVPVMALALWLFWKSHHDLGTNWSMHLELREGHELVTRGIYKHIRHPMYSAIWLFSWAQALLLSNVVAGWSALLFFAPLYFARTPREEAMMCETFGQPYRDYMRHTGRLWPRLTPPSAGA